MPTVKISGPFEVTFFIDSMTSFKAEAFKEESNGGVTLCTEKVQLSKDELAIVIMAFKRKQIIEFKIGNKKNHCVITAFEEVENGFFKFELYPI